MESAFPPAWTLFSDTAVSLPILLAAAKAYSVRPGHTALIGSMPVAPPTKDRARHASAVGATPLVAPEMPTVFQLIMESPVPDVHEVQWAVITLLAVDATFRDGVAAMSPPRAASLIRGLPDRYERYLLGVAEQAAMTPSEAVCDFLIRLELVHSSVADVHVLKK